MTANFMSLAAGTRRSRRAFSLVELLTGLGIFAVLALILLSVSQNVSNAWVSTQNRSTLQQSARAIMDFVTKDLQCALPPIIPDSPGSLQLIRNPSSLSPSYNTGHTLFWEAPIALNVPNASDIAILGYFIRWNGTKPVLCRLFVTSADGDDYRIGTGDDWINDALLEKYAPASQAGKYLGLMAENVAGFWAEPLDTYGKVITTPADFDSRLGYTDSMGTSYSPGTLPPAIRISFALLTPRTAGQLTPNLRSSLQTLANECSNADEFYAKALENASLKPVQGGIYTYTSTIPLINHR